MKITGLKQQVSQPSRYSVYVDGKFSFGLSANAVLDSQLIVGEELDEQRLQDLKSLSANDKAYGNALRYVTMRQRSEWEVVTYLQRKKVDKQLSEDIIIRLRALNLLDDRSFARAWVANRRLLKATNKRRLAQELRQKRVSDSVVEIVLAEDDTDESAVLRELVAKKRQIPRFRDDDLKLMQYLARQGYDYDAIKSAMNKTDEDMD
jgi:regulatory protein